MMFRSEAGTVKSADSEPGHHSDCGPAFQSSRQKDRHTIEVRLHAMGLLASSFSYKYGTLVAKVHGLDKQFVQVLRIRIRDPVLL
jgi:hypothetical protein